MNPLPFKCHGVRKHSGVKSRPYLWDVGSSVIMPVMSICFHFCHQNARHITAPDTAAFRCEYGSNSVRRDTRALLLVGKLPSACRIWEMRHTRATQNLKHSCWLTVHRNTTLTLLYRSSQQQNLEFAVLVFPFVSKRRTLRVWLALYLHSPICSAANIRVDCSLYYNY